MIAMVTHVKMKAPVLTKSTDTTVNVLLGLQETIVKQVSFQFRTIFLASIKPLAETDKKEKKKDIKRSSPPQELYKKSMTCIE